MPSSTLIALASAPRLEKDWQSSMLAVAQNTVVRETNWKRLSRLHMQNGEGFGPFPTGSALWNSNGTLAGVRRLVKRSRDNLRDLGCNRLGQ
jgi:hypothetical protein